MSDSKSNELLEVDNGITDAQHKKLDQIARSFRPLWIWRLSNAGSSPSLEDLTYILADIVKTSPKHLNELYQNPDDAQEFLTNHPLIESRLRTIISSDASFKGIRSLRVLQAPGSLCLEDKPIDTDSLEQAFYETDYRGTAGDIFLDLIQRRDKHFYKLDDTSKDRYYAKFLSIVQSSGTGKSRLVHELGKQGKVILFYMNFGTSPGAFPLKDQTLLRLLRPDETGVQLNAKEYQNLGERFPDKVQKFEAIYCAFYAAIFRSYASEAKEFRAKYPNELGKIPRKWYQTFFGPQAIVRRRKLFENMEEHFWEALGAIMHVAVEAGDKPEERKVIGSNVILKAYKEAVSELNLMLGNNVPLLIVFDEAAKLVESQQGLEKSEVKQSHILCRVISAFSHRTFAPIWTVFISTNSRIGDFSGSPKTQSSDRLRLGGELLFRPFTELGLHQFAKPFKDIDLERVWEYENLIGFGRPLWKALGDTWNNDLSEVIRLGRLKLVKGYFEGTDEQFLAILSQRFCLDLVFGHPLTVKFEEEAVAGYMRFLITTSENRDILYSTYPIEPILSQAAAELLWDPSDCNASLIKAIDVLNKRVTSGMINRGTSGELAARLLLLLAKDICARELHPRKNELRYCGSVKLIRWLKVLFGEDVFLRQVDKSDADYGRKLEERVQEHFGNAVINFSHWIGMLEDIEKEELRVRYPPHPEWLPRLFATTGAAQCRHMQPLIDNVIPAYDTVTKKVFPVLTQDKATVGKNKAALQAIRPGSNSIGLSEDDPCAIILMDLDCSGKKDPAPAGVVVTLNERGTPRLRIHAMGCSEKTYIGLKGFIGIIEKMVMLPKEPQDVDEKKLIRMREFAKTLRCTDNVRWEQ